MDAQCRMLLEHSYEAVLDAGLNPLDLKGTKTGVFTGVCLTESERDVSSASTYEGYTIIG